MMGDLSLKQARVWDAEDDLRDFRFRFLLPPGVVYLDGNSLGALPKSTLRRITQITELEWGHDLIRSWNLHNWINAPVAVGSKIARIIGADESEVLVTDTTSVNLFRLVVA